MWLWQASFYFAWRNLSCNVTAVRHATQAANGNQAVFTVLPMCLDASSAHLTRQPFSPLRETRSPPFSFQKSLSLSEWPFTTGPFAKCLPLQQSSSNQCEQSGQMIFRNDLLSNSSQFTFLSPESPSGVIQAACGRRGSQRHFKPCLRCVVCFPPLVLAVESAAFPSTVRDLITF